MDLQCYKLYARLIWSLGVMDFKKRYCSTFLGSLWAFLSPLTTILLIYFVMTYGLKITQFGDKPFVPRLIAGIMAWFFCQEYIASGVTVMKEYSHLVTKQKFPFAILPLARMLPSVFTHAVLLVLFIIYQALAVGLPHTWLQVIYYFTFAAVLCLGITYLTSSIMVFYGDIANGVNIVLQILFWVTPIFWDENTLTANKFGFIFWNPFWYIVNGYRESLLDGVSLWQNWEAMLAFWGGAGLVVILGAIVFSRSSKHFADVL